jgi:hypothetical protein
MFNLEENLRNWRENFQSAEAMRGSDVDELDQHVRDSIAGLQSKGLSEQEAFAVATHCVGGSELLAGEFAKVNGRHMWTQRVFWMIAGVLVFWVSQISIAALSSIGEVAAALWSGNGIVMAIVPIGITVLAWSAIAFTVRKCCIRESGFSWWPVSSTRLTVGIVAAILVGTLTSGFSRMAFMTTATMSEIGRAMIIGSVANSLLSIIGPLVLLVVVLAMRQRPEPSYSA